MSVLASVTEVSGTTVTFPAASSICVTVNFVLVEVAETDDFTTSWESMSIAITAETGSVNSNGVPDVTEPAYDDLASSPKPRP